MKQKFTFEIDSAKGLLTLAEAGELDLGSFTKLQEESYNLEEMKAAAQSGQAAFIEKMRRRNLFPPNDLAIKLFEAAEKMLQNDTVEKTVVEYEDAEALPLMEDARILYGGDDDDDEDDDDDVEIGSLLKDDPDDVSEDDIKEIDSDDDTPKFMPDDDSEHEN